VVAFLIGRISNRKPLLSQQTTAEIGRDGSGTTRTGASGMGKPDLDYDECDDHVALVTVKVH
jgi:hypothetical protein